jgi:hypothetical protein
MRRSRRRHFFPALLVRVLAAHRGYFARRFLCTRLARITATKAGAVRSKHFDGPQQLQHLAFLLQAAAAAAAAAAALPLQAL